MWAFARLIVYDTLKSYFNSTFLSLSLYIKFNEEKWRKKEEYL